MPLDPDIQIMLEQMKQIGFPHPGELSAAEMRAVFEGVSCGMPVGPEMERVEDHSVDADVAVPVRPYIPRTPIRAVLLHLHGGGWTLGGIESRSI
jgi:acetyl esterase/lipase